MSALVAPILTQHDAVLAQQTGHADITPVRPAGGTVGFHTPPRPRAPDRQPERYQNGKDDPRDADAWSDEHGQIRYRKGLLATLERRELDRVGGEMAAARGTSYRTMADGEKMRGTLKEKVRLASGTYALVENAQEFVLVPWKPVIEKRLGQELTGVMRAGAIDWQLGRERGLGV